LGELTIYLSVRPKLASFFRSVTIFIIYAHFLQVDRSIPKQLEDAFSAADKRSSGKAAFGSFGYSKATSANAASRAFIPAAA
jgi:hypothetical protein